jgi:hypothetical protein
MLYDLPDQERGDCRRHGVPLRHGDMGIAAGRTVKIGDGAKRIIGA